MSSYRELKAEIQSLREQAEIARLDEKNAALDAIRALIVEWQLLPSDLGLATATPRKSAAPAAAAKYRDPASGATWSGRGRTPNWLAGQADRSAFEIR